MSIVVVACSDTESVSMSVVIKRGFAALRYLNAGKLIMPEESIAIPTIIAPPKSARPLRNWFLPNILLIMTHPIRNAVHPIRKNPLRLDGIVHIKRSSVAELEVWSGLDDNIK